MRLLVIGGTVFVGRHVVETARARGHEVTVFHRGQHGEAAVPNVEHLHGDRTGDLAVLRGRQWDAVVDTCGFGADDTAPVANLLADAVGHYGFLSSVSVYATWPAEAVDESAPVVELGDENEYAAGKVDAERVLTDVFRDRLLISRPATIVGPHENIARLPYWLRRMARGGDVLAPGDPAEPRQWVDARDLAEWHVELAESRTGGLANVVCRPAFTMGELLEQCLQVTGGDARLVWRDGAAITAAGIEPWTELPLWLYEPHEPSGGTWQIVSDRAHALGYAPRPMADTVADTWAWLVSGRDDADGYRSDRAVVTLDPAKEQAALGVG